jgi:hypothetical protein
MMKYEKIEMVTNISKDDKMRRIYNKHGTFFLSIDTETKILR